MTQEKRKYPRRPIDLKIEIKYPSGQTELAHTRDISEGGLFLLLSEAAQPVLGEVIGLSQVAGPDSPETLPSGEAVVVHRAQDGIGVAFIVMDLDDDHDL